MTDIFLSRTVLYVAGDPADETALHEICKGREGTTDFDTLGYAYDEADAHRFAAAGQMLDSLKAIYKWWTEQPAFHNGEDDMPAEIFDGMRNAIVNARGRQ
jgi:hypothetical protein